MTKNNKFLVKYKIFIIIGTLFVIWACFVFFIIVPSVKLLKDDFDAVQMKLLDAKVNDEKLSKINNLKEEFDRVNGEKDNLEVIFSKNNIVELVKELELIAQETGNKINVSVDEENKALIEVGKEKAGANPKENEFLKKLPTENYLTIKIGLEGNYNSLIKFLNKLNNIKYYNSVVSFKIISEKLAIEDKSIKGDVNVGVSVMTGNNNEMSLSSAEKERLVLSSNLNVIFYSLEKNEGKK
jgi:seryl-tRNA synthetase